ncbi:DUF4199 domain-containing protein [Fulvivirgaceae bacterium BMA10]|uniref:DUF4199 domain-containing protein n=1 Tax=Splendidivirga corallicola TaxID=3051826 RepID=A0ABT8KLD0_9BACT|nr:DUF4199 domain-containing protein [Fulvivirgaceae bacterium BMA10]
MLKKTILLTPLKYGAFGGVLSIALFLLLYYIHENPLIAVKKLPFAIILLPLFIFFSIKEFRDHKNNGTLHFWQGLAIGFINYTIIAILSSLFIGIFLTYFDPGLLKDFIDKSILLIEANKDQTIETFGQETYEQLLLDTKNTTVRVIALDDFWRKIFIGLITSFIISIILRKNNL